MCDSLCSLGPERTLFAKNSDRWPGEAQVWQSWPRRAGGGPLAATHLTIDDAGAVPLVGSRPTWQWGLEHGVNQHGVAIGNEQLWTVDDPAHFPDGLTGLDLVRLGLERGASASGAIEVMTDLLDTFGQGGVADQHQSKAYFSSFLAADADEAWILETSGRSWAARRVPRTEGGAAISNRISLSTDWTTASPDVVEAQDFDRWRRASSPTAHADRRLAVTRAAVTAPAQPTARDLARVLRDHGGGPGADHDVGPLPPAVIDRLGTGVSVCLHLTEVQATTASVIVSLPVAGRGQPIRAWVSLGSPCASLFVPVFPFDPGSAPDALGQASTWTRLADLGRHLERLRVSDPARADDRLHVVHQAWAELEDQLWDEADDLVEADPADRRRWQRAIWPRMALVLDGLGG
jgi:secernin